MFSRAELQKFLVVYAWAASTEEAFMNIIEELKGQYDTAEQLWSNYRDRLKGFRSEVKNDLTSIEAAGRKVTGATERMLSAYGGVLGLLNSPQMVEAVNNAERLAEAMERLSKMSAHRLVFEVADETKSAR